MRKWYADQTTKGNLSLSSQMKDIELNGQEVIQLTDQDQNQLEILRILLVSSGCLEQRTTISSCLLQGPEEIVKDIRLVIEYQNVLHERPESVDINKPRSFTT
jgi:hypothetical protein